MSKKLSESLAKDRATKKKHKTKISCKNCCPRTEAGWQGRRHNGRNQHCLPEIHHLEQLHITQSNQHHIASRTNHQTPTPWWRIVVIQCDQSKREQWSSVATVMYCLQPACGPSAYSFLGSLFLSNHLSFHFIWWLWSEFWEGGSPTMFGECFLHTRYYPLMIQWESSPDTVFNGIAHCCCRRFAIV